MSPCVHSDRQGWTRAAITGHLITGHLIPVLKDKIVHYAAKLFVFIKVGVGKYRGYWKRFNTVENLILYV